MLTAAGSIGQASGDLLRHIGEGETDERFQVCVYAVGGCVQCSCIQIRTYSLRKSNTIAALF